MFHFTKSKTNRTASQNPKVKLGQSYTRCLVSINHKLGFTVADGSTLKGYMASDEDNVLPTVRLRSEKRSIVSVGVNIVRTNQANLGTKY